RIVHPSSPRLHLRVVGMPCSHPAKASAVRLLATRELVLTQVRWVEIVGCWPSLSEDSIDSERQLSKTGTQNPCSGYFERNGDLSSMLRNSLKYRLGL